MTWPLQTPLGSLVDSGSCIYGVSIERL